MTTGNTFNTRFTAEDAASGVIDNLVASGRVLQQTYEGINPTFRKLSASMEGVVTRSTFVKDALQTLGEIKGIPGIEKQIASVDRGIVKLESKRVGLLAKREIKPSEAVDIRLNELQREENFLISQRTQLSEELSRRQALSLTDAQKAAVALNQEAQGLREITIEGPQTSSVLDSLIGRLEVIQSTLQTAGGERLARSLAPQIEELKQYSATLKVNEQDVKSTLTGKGQAIVNLGRQFTQSTSEAGIALNQVDATVQGSAQILLGMSSQLISTARSSTLYATANEMVRTGQQGLLTEEQRGILALEALGLKMRQMATGEAPLAAGAVQRLAVQVSTLGQSVPGISNQLAGMAPVLREQGKALKETEIQASRTAGSFGFMADVSPKVQQGMRAMSAASQGFMLSNSLLQRNLTGVAFSLIFMQFSGVLKLSAAFAGLTLAGGLAYQALSKIWKQKQEAKALADAMFVVTGSTDAYARSVEVAEKVTKELGLTGGLQTKASQGLAKAFASMRLQGLEPTIDSAKEFIDFFLIMEAGTQGGIKDIDQFIREFLQFKKDGTGSLSEIVRGSNDVARALYTLQGSTVTSISLSAEEVSLLATKFKEVFKVSIPADMLTSITSIDSFVLAVEQLVAAGKVPATVLPEIQAFTIGVIKEQGNISSVMSTLQSDLDKKWKEIGAGTTPASQAFSKLGTDAKTTKEDIGTVVQEAVDNVGKLKDFRDGVVNAAWPPEMKEKKDKILAYYDEVIARAEHYLGVLLEMTRAQREGLTTVPGTAGLPPASESSPGGEIDKGSAGWGGFTTATSGGGSAQGVTVQVNVDVHDNNVGSSGQSNQLAQEIEDAVMSGISRGVKISGMPVIQ